MNIQKETNKKLSIGEIASQVGIAPSTIRYYEQIGLISKATRVSGQRRFEQKIIIKLKMIRIAQQLGWSLNEIKALLDSNDPVISWKNQVPQKILDLDLIIEHIQAQKRSLSQSLDCTCQRFQDCVLLS